MRTLTKYITILVCLSSATLTQAQEADPFEKDQINKSKPKQIRIYTESYEITAVEFATLMTTPTNKNNHDNMRDSLLEMVKKNDAKLVDNHTLICRSGEKATLESIREYIYATEDIPANGLPVGKKDDPQIEPRIFPGNPPTPTAFETRNLGHTLEVEPIIGADGETIDLRLAPESTKHVDDHVISEWTFPYAKITIAYPTFYTKRLNTAVTVKDGVFLLASTYSPELEGKVDHSRKILYFVRAEVLIVGGE